MTTPRLTEADAAWLRKLKEEGPQRHPSPSKNRSWEHCFDAGWADFTGNDVDFITPAGLAALAEHEERAK